MGEVAGQTLAAATRFSPYQAVALPAETMRGEETRGTAQSLSVLELET